MTKTPEEKAREYAKQYQDLPIVSQYQKNRRYMFKSSYDGFLSGYHSRDEEVQELREALKEMLKMFDDLDNTLFDDNHSVLGWHLNGDHEPVMNFVADSVDYNVIAKAKQLLNKQ